MDDAELATRIRAGTLAEADAAPAVVAAVRGKLLVADPAHLGRPA